MTLIVNLYGGPGTGKSTTAARVFAELKMSGVEAELATEYAKDLTWEERHRAFTFQPYVLSKQAYRVHRLIGKVAVVVTDSPILLSRIYRGDEPASFHDFVLDLHNSWNTLDVFLRRNADKHYSELGRHQTRAQARQIDSQIKTMLDGAGIHYHSVLGPPYDCVPWIVETSTQMIDEPR